MITRIKRGATPRESAVSAVANLASRYSPLPSLVLQPLRPLVCQQIQPENTSALFLRFAAYRYC